MSGILVVTGGAETARSVYRDERRGYWAAGLTVVLEKHGLLGVAHAGPDALLDRERLAAHPVVLVARQAPGTFTPDVVDALQGLRGGALVEGPLPALLMDVLGMRAIGAGRREGLVQVVDAGLRAAAAPYGPAGGRVGSGARRHVPVEAEMRWDRLPAPIAADQAAAWRTPGWDVQRWVADGDALDVLAEWTPAGDARGRQPAVVRRGALVGTALGLLSFLAQSHTVEPFEGGEFRTWPRTAGVEALLLGLIDLLHARTGAVRARLRPWPSGVRLALNVRHDVDRPPTVEQVADTVGGHAALGTAATWYWRARHLKPGARQATGNSALRLVAGDPRHEVALHTERMWAGGEAEREAIEQVAGAPILGSSSHGDPTCFRYQGAPNLLWAADQGLLYTEFISHSHPVPHRPLALTPEGDVVPLEVLCLPHHASFDRSAKPGHTDPQGVLREADRLSAAGGLVQVLNHPDINVPELFKCLAQIPRSGCWDVTAADAAAWWRATHTPRGLASTALENGCLRLDAHAGADRLVIELRSPDGATSERTVSLEAGGSITVGP